MVEQIVDEVSIKFKSIDKMLSEIKKLSEMKEETKQQISTVVTMINKNKVCSNDFEILNEIRLEHPLLQNILYLAYYRLYSKLEHPKSVSFQRLNCNTSYVTIYKKNLLGQLIHDIPALAYSTLSYNKHGKKFLIEYICGLKLTTLKSWNSTNFEERLLTSIPPRSPPRKICHQQHDKANNNHVEQTSKKPKFSAEETKKCMERLVKDKYFFK